MTLGHNVTSESLDTKDCSLIKCSQNVWMLAEVLRQEMPETEAGVGATLGEGDTWTCTSNI